MISTLTNELQQTYSSDNETVKVDILYNNSFDYFYFNIFLNGELIKGDTRIINNFENEYLTLTSLNANYGKFEDIESFIIEVKDYE